MEDARRHLLRAQGYGFLSDQNLDIHIEHSENFINQIGGEEGRILDLGSGGGLPSLVWLALDPDISITALDAMKKRCDFLESVRLSEASLLSRFQVLNARAEELARDVIYKHTFQLIVARGFASPSVTAECATGLLSLGGRLVVSARPDKEEDRWDTQHLLQLGMQLKEITSLGSSHAAHIVKISLENPKFPRRSAPMKKSPLW